MILNSNTYSDRGCRLWLRLKCKYSVFNLVWQCVVLCGICGCLWSYRRTKTHILHHLQHWPSDTDNISNYRVRRYDQSVYLLQHICIMSIVKIRYSEDVVGVYWARSGTSDISRFQISLNIEIYLGWILDPVFTVL